MIREFLTPARFKMVGIALALPLYSGFGWAEVGVVLDGSAVRGPYLHEIVDDPSPVGGIWARVSVASSRVVLNSEGAANGDGNPEFAFDPVSNLPVVVWSKNNAGNFDVVVSVFSAGAWSTPQVVVGSADNELDPSLVVDATGVVHLFYWVNTGTTQRVYYTHAPSDLTSWSVPVAVSGIGEAACRPGAAVYNGLVQVAYEVHPGGFGSLPRQIARAAYYGGAFVSEIVASSNNPSEVWPRARSHSGRLWVEWVDSASSSDPAGELGWMRWDPTLLQWGPRRIDLFATTEERDFSVRPGIRLEAIAP